MPSLSIWYREPSKNHMRIYKWYVLYLDAIFEMCLVKYDATQNTYTALVLDGQYAGHRSLAPLTRFDCDTPVIEAQCPWWTLLHSLIDRLGRLALWMFNLDPMNSEMLAVFPLIHVWPYWLNWPPILEIIWTRKKMRDKTPTQACFHLWPWNGSALLMRVVWRWG